MLIPEIAEEYLNLVDEAEGRMHARVTVARETDDAGRAAIGLPRARQRTLRELCDRLASGELVLGDGADRAAVRARLLAIPGVGPWTAAYVRMRALGDRDAFPASDLGVVKALARHGVAVNAIAPGVTDTPQLEVDAQAAGVSRAEIVERYAEGVPFGRVGRPADIASAAAFLCSEAAAAMVGQVVGPNGGTTTARA
jgi:3-methyladenine DNA glycosylase/8-oxoguanine DNA glycosylase